MIINNININVIEHLTESKKLVIISHGIAEHIGRYEKFISNLVKAGFSVVGYDLEGHGLSGGNKGNIKSYKNFISTLHELVNHYRSRFDKIFLFGHSMGGGIVCAYNGLYQDVDGIIASGASVYTPKSAMILKFIPGALMGFIKKQTKFGSDLTHDEKIVKNYQTDPLVLKYFYIKLVNEMFIKCTNFIKKNTKKMVTPILFVHGAKDTIVSPSLPKKLFSKLLVKDKEIIIYPRSKHEILNDLEKQQATKDIITWINKH